MLAIKSVPHLAQQLGIDVISPSTTVLNVVEELVSLGNTDKVYPFHDSYLGLELSLPDNLLKTSILDIADLEESDQHDSHHGLKPNLPEKRLNTSLPDFADEDERNEYMEGIEKLLEEGGTVLELAARELTEADSEMIHEDRQSRGVEIDD